MRIFVLGCAFAAIAACESRSKGDPVKLPKEEIPKETLTSPKGDHKVTIVASIEGLRYAGHTGGCAGGEVPTVDTPAGASLDASAVFRARVDGVVPVLNGELDGGVVFGGTADADGFTIGTGRTRKTIDAARDDAKRGTIASCWSADGSRVAMRAVLDDPDEWTIVRFADGVVSFGVVILTRGDSCDVAIKKEPLWHPSKPL